MSQYPTLNITLYSFNIKLLLLENKDVFDIMNYLFDNDGKYIV